MKITSLSGIVCLLIAAPSLCLAAIAGEHTETTDITWTLTGEPFSHSIDPLHYAGHDLYDDNFVWSIPESVLLPPTLPPTPTPAPTPVAVESDSYVASRSVIRASDAAKMALTDYDTIVYDSRNTRKSYRGSRHDSIADDGYNLDDVTNIVVDDVRKSVTNDKRIEDEIAEEFEEHAEEVDVEHEAKPAVVHDEVEAPPSTVPEVLVEKIALVKDVKNVDELIEEVEIAHEVVDNYVPSKSVGVKTGTSSVPVRTVAKSGALPRHGFSSDPADFFSASLLMSDDVRDESETYAALVANRVKETYDYCELVVANDDKLSIPLSAYLRADLSGKNKSDTNIPEELSLQKQLYNTYLLSSGSIDEDISNYRWSTSMTKLLDIVFWILFSLLMLALLSRYRKPVSKQILHFKFFQ